MEEEKKKLIFSIEQAGKFTPFLSEDSRHTLVYIINFKQRTKNNSIIIYFQEGMLQQIICFIWLNIKLWNEDEIESWGAQKVKYTIS